MRKALELALEALEECRRDPRLKYEHPIYDKTIIALRQAIEQAQKQEPVAWLNPYGGVVQKRMDGHERTHYTIPLYTSPPQRQPLSDEQLKQIWLNGKDHGDDWLDVQGIARAIEAVHGITGEKE